MGFKIKHTNTTQNANNWHQPKVKKGYLSSTVKIVTDSRWQHNETISIAFFVPFYHSFNGPKLLQIVEAYTYLNLKKCNFQDSIFKMFSSRRSFEAL